MTGETERADLIGQIDEIEAAIETGELSTPQIQGKLQAISLKAKLQGLTGTKPTVRMEHILFTDDPSEQSPPTTTIITGDDGEVERVWRMPGKGHMIGPGESPPKWTNFQRRKAIEMYCCQFPEASSADVRAFLKTRGIERSKRGVSRDLAEIWGKKGRGN